MKKFLFLIALLIIGITSAWSQEQSQPTWMMMMKDPNVNFYDLQKEFYKAWEGKEIEKGKGYKQFKRFEAFMKPRVYPTGYLPQDIIVKELENLLLNKTSGAAANWTAMGPTTVPVNGLSYPSAGIGRINCIRFDPQDNNIVWVGTPGGGLWKTTNGGTTWTSNTDNFASLGISDVAIHPTNSSIMYVATGDFDASDTYSIGVLKSTNGGSTWQNTGLVHQTSTRSRIARLLINPSNPDVLIAATSTGIMRSSNAGTSWTTIVSGIFSDVEFKPGDPNTVYAASFASSGNAKMYVSTNGGTSFTAATGLPSSDALRISVAVSAASPTTVYALICNSSAGYKGLYKSTNSGSSYTLVHSAPNLMSGDESGAGTGGQGWYDLTIAVSPLDANIIYIGGVNAWKSTNGGTSFSITGHWYAGNSGNLPFLHADQHYFEFQPGSSIIFAGNDGGIRKSTNNGSSWTDLSNGLQISQFYRISAAKSNAEIVYAGAQDNGTNRYLSTAWSSVYGGDGMQPLVDYNNSNIVYASTQYGGLQRSSNGGTSFSSIKPSAAPDGAWITPYVLHPTTSSTIFAGFDEIYKSTNSGSTWTAITSNLLGGALYEVLAIAASDPNVIYGGSPSKIVKTTNGGTSWTSITTGLPIASAEITSIAVSNTDANKIWVSFSGYASTAKIYFSSNGGTTWTNLSSGLPNIPVNTIEYQNNSDDAIYVGTDVGVYYKSNSVAWTSYMTNLPNVKVYDLDIHYGTGKIRAATFGRGLWQSDLYGTAVAAPVANFSASSTNINTGASINFTDLSTNSPTTWAWTFTGGTPSSSTSQNPSNIVYNTAGTYAVSLTASNTGGSDAETKTGYITVTAVGLAPVANFSANSTSVIEGQTVVFSDLSTNTPTSWSWTFTGGTPSSSTVQNPSIVYNTAGTYAVSLTASNGTGSDVESKTAFITVTEAGALNCKSWSEQATGFSSINRGIESIEVVNANVVWAVAYDGSGGGATIRDYTRTTNGGTTWVASSINVGSANYGLANITAIHADTAWASIYPTTATVTAQGVYKTVNGGTTWTKQTTATFNTATSFINFVHFFNSNDGLAQGDPAGGYFEIYTTNNGGTTWTRVPSANIPTPIASDEYGTVGYFTANGNNFWFTTNKGRIFRSSDKGLNWTAASTPLGLNVTLTNIAFRDANNGYVTGLNPSTQADVGLYKTTDGGATWTLWPVSTSTITAKSAIEYVPGSTSTYYVSGATAGASGTAYTNDDGATWTLIDNIQHTALGFLNESTGWTGGFNSSNTTGGIFKLSLQSVNASINTPSQTSFCAGQSVLLSANTGTNLTYQWYLNGNTINGATNSFHNASAAGSYTVEVFEGTCSAISTAVQLSLNPNPSVPTIIGFNSFCQGDSTVLQTPAATTHVWYKNNVPIQNATSNSLIVKESGTYKVKITNTFGCENTSADFVINVTALPAKPVVSASASTELCEPETVSLSSSAVSNIQWYKDGVAINGATQSVLSVNSTGSYYVRANTSNGNCGINSDVTVVNVYPKAIKPLITRDTTSLTSTAAVSYQWIKNNVDIPFASAQTYIVTETGAYKVRITDINACENTSDAEVVIISGIQNQTVIDQAVIYPNPSTGKFSLEYNLITDANVSIVLTNMLGQVVQEISFNEMQLQGKHKIELQENVRGMYVLQMRTEYGSKEMKVMISD
jgi:PKD repeat protein